MGEQVKNWYTWVLKNFSSLQDERCYSRPFPFAGCNWNIIAYPNGYKNTEHLSVFLGIVNPESLPSGWRRELKFSLTIVNKKFYTYTKELEGQSWFDARSNSWGFKEFLPLLKIRCRDDGFLVGDKLVIVAELHVFPVVVLPEETVKVIGPLSCKEGNQAADESVQKSVNVDASQEKVDYDESQEIPCVDASEEGLDDDDASEEGLDDDGASEEGSDDGGSEEGQNDDNASSLVSEDESREKGPLNQSNSLRCNSVASETEISNVDNDDAPTEDPGDVDVIQNDQGDDNASSLASGVSDRDVGSLKKFDDASQRAEDGDMKCNKVVESVTEASTDIPKEFQPVKETKDVNGFRVFSSQVELVRHIFKRHPDIALGFRPKNQEIRRTYMNELLSLIDTLCQPPEKLSEDDLSKADDTLADLIDVGFKLDWLKIKLDEVSEKKQKEKGSVARLQTVEEQLQKLKLIFSNLETQLQMEKAEALAARVPLSFNDVVC